MAEVKSAIAGKIAEINIRVGDAVTDDDEIILLDVMKMETPIFGENGTVKEILVAKGESVSEGQTLVVIE
jgi:acetyl-CoA carboxylase biotin carboxyl carrier protein